MTQAHTGQLATHLAAADARSAAASAFALQTGGGGLILGRGPDGSALSVGVFRSEPTVIALVGGMPFAQLVAFRAVALGARIRIRTSRPNGWQSFVNLAAGASGSIRLLDERTEAPAGSPNAPVLVVLDNDSPSSADARSEAAWTTILTVHDQLTQWNSGSLSDADLVVVHSLSLAEARLVGAALGRSDAERSLASLPTGSATVISRRLARTAQVVPTDIERWMIGPMERGAVGVAPPPRVSR